MVLIDMASRVQQRFSSFHHRYGILFPETYNLMDRIEEKYGITIEKVYSLLSPEEQERTHGTRFGPAIPTCAATCEGRTAAPEVAGTERLDHEHPPRSDLGPFARARIEWDAKFGLVKVNPIVDWTSKQVWRYIHDHDVPYNALHDQDYPSIGCTHCTRAVRPGEDPRAGRWPGFAKTECGLHIIEPAPAQSRRRRKAAKIGN